MRSLLLIAVAVVFGWTHLAAGDEDPLIAEIRKAWQERHDRFKSFEIDWVQQETTPRGSLDQGVPAADVVHDISCRLVAEGENFYHHRKGQQFDLQLRKFIDNEYISTLNGSERRYLFQGEKYGRHPSGRVHAADRTFDSGDWNIEPPIWSFRPRSPVFDTLDLEKWTVTARRETVDSVPCIVLERRQAGSQFYHLIYVAASGDHRIVRVEHFAPTAQTLQITVRYVESALGLVCGSWTIVEWSPNGGTLHKTTVVPKVSLRINERIDPATFELKFPPGTVVLNRQTKVEAVVRKDYSMRPFSPGERSAGKSWDDLMESDPLPGTAPFYGQEEMNWSLWIAVAVIAGAVAWVFWTRARRAGSS